MSCPPQRPKTDEGNQIHPTLSGHVFPILRKDLKGRCMNCLGTSPSQASFLWFRGEDMGHVITDTPKVRQDRRTDAHCQYHSLRIARRIAQGTHNGKWKKRCILPTVSVETPSFVYPSIRFDIIIFLFNKEFWCNYTTLKRWFFNPLLLFNHFWLKYFTFFLSFFFLYRNDMKHGKGCGIYVKK